MSGDIFMHFPDVVDRVLADLFVIMCVQSAGYVIVLQGWGLLKLMLRAGYDLKGDLARLRV